MHLIASWVREREGNSQSSFDSRLTWIRQAHDIILVAVRTLIFLNVAYDRARRALVND